MDRGQNKGREGAPFLDKVQYRVHMGTYANAELYLFRTRIP